jgi:hypothetical protein
MGRRVCYAPACCQYFFRDDPRINKSFSSTQCTRIQSLARNPMTHIAVSPCDIIVHKKCDWVDETSNTWGPRLAGGLSKVSLGFLFDRPLVRFPLLVFLFIRKDVDRAIGQRKILRLLRKAVAALGRPQNGQFCISPEYVVPYIFGGYAENPNMKQPTSAWFYRCLGMCGAGFSSQTRPKVDPATSLPSP